VGAAAGVSRTAPYRHFADKEELLAAVAARALHTLGAEMLRSRDAAGDDPRARLEAVLTAYVDGALAHPALYRLIFSEDTARREHAELLDAGGAGFAVLAAAVTEARDARVLPSTGDATRLTAVLWSAAHGVADLVLAGHGTAAKGTDDPRELVRLLLRLIGC